MNFFDQHIHLSKSLNMDLYFGTGATDNEIDCIHCGMSQQARKK